MLVFQVYARNFVYMNGYDDDDYYYYYVYC